MKRFMVVLALGCLLICATHGEAYCGHRFGGGLHYLRTLGDIKDVPEFDANSLGFLASYEYTLTLLKIEGDLEWIPDFGGSDKSLWVPQAWGLIGSMIYGGVGIGIGYIDGDWQDNPFYALRAGVDLGLGGLGLDVFASYQFQTTKVFEEFESDDLNSITFGAIVRF
jgi:hypothetical protein